MNRFIVQFNKLLFDRNREEDRAEFDTKIVSCGFLNFLWFYTQLLYTSLILDI
jgi:hypothetical protein